MRTNPMNSELTIQKEIKAPVAMIYDAWLSPESIKVWMCPGDGISVPNPIINARVGGKFDFTMKVGTSMLPHTGEYKTLNRPKQIQFTWNSQHAGFHDSLVTIDLEDLGNSKTLLKLHHQMLPNEVERANHFGGWSQAIECLIEFCKRGTFGRER